MKKCTKCKNEKLLTDFNKNKKRKDGYNNICRICSNQKSRDYYFENKEEHSKNVSQRNKNIKLDNRRKLFEYYLTHPCVDCGERDPIVLEFDHKGNKKIEVSKLVSNSYSWETIMEEINKCDVRCANCHRRRTAKQFGWYKEFIK